MISRRLLLGAAAAAALMCGGSTTAVAQIEITVRQVHVAVADAAGVDLQQYFGAGGSRRFALCLDQRLAELLDLKASHPAALRHSRARR